MLELYQTPVDILYFVLSVCVALLTLFLVLALYNLIRIFGNVRHITEKTQDTLDLVNHYLWQPIKILMMIIEKGREYAETRAKKGKKE